MQGRPRRPPALKEGTIKAAASIATRVFPEPPGPVKVTRRAPSSILESTSSTSPLLPTKELAGRGRFVFEIVLSGGKVSSPSWKIETGPSMSLRRCSPRSVRAKLTAPAVALETTT
jgi:hypothetical protein